MSMAARDALIIRVIEQKDKLILFHGDFIFSLSGICVLSLV